MIVLDDYVMDVLMRDLVGHDRAPSAFLVYLHLWSESEGRQKSAVERQPSDDRRSHGPLQKRGPKRSSLPGAKKADQGPQEFADRYTGVSCPAPVAPLSIATLHYKRRLKSDMTRMENIRDFLAAEALRVYRRLPPAEGLLASPLPRIP